jgi:hypothetical protein
MKQVWEFPLPVNGGALIVNVVSEYEVHEVVLAETLNL